MDGVNKWSTIHRQAVSYVVAEIGVISFSLDVKRPNYYYTIDGPMVTFAPDNESLLCHVAK
jgi:hypothetical protein